MGYLLKADLNIMKVATNLHVIESLLNADVVPTVIDHKYVEMAAGIVMSLVRGIPKIAEYAGSVGDESVIDAIVAYLRKNGKRSRRQLYNAMRHKPELANIAGSKRSDGFDRALALGVQWGSISMRTVAIDGKMIETFTVSK